MSYTPTVWQAGDTITSQRLNKIEQGIAGAGGGAGGMVVNGTVSGGDTTLDTTAGDLWTAYAAGSNVVMLRNHEGTDGVGDPISVYGAYALCTATQDSDNGYTFVFGSDTTITLNAPTANDYPTDA